MTETPSTPATPAPIDPAAQPPITPPAPAPVAVPPVVPPVTPAPLAASAVDPWAALEDPELKAFVGTKSPADVAKELKAAQALIGKKTVGVPGEGSTPEEQAAFHAARGVPATADAYKFDDVIADITKDLPEGVFALDPEREKRARDFFKNSNISNSEARELIKRELGHEIEQAKTQAAASAASQRAMSDLVSKDWGNKTEEYTQDANNYMRAIGIDDDVLSVMNSALGSKPEARMKFLEMARKQGALLREGGQPVPGGGPVVPSGMSPEQARTAKEQFLAQGDNRAIYLGNRDHPRYKAIEAQVTAFVKVERGIK